jgi:hypothetical protein
MPSTSTWTPGYRSRVLFSRSLVGIAATEIGPEVAVPAEGNVLSLETVFVRAAGGTSVNVYLQTSLDGGATWFDIANQAFLTTTASKLSAVSRKIAPAAQAGAPGDAALAGGTILQGILGDRIRAKIVTAGTYTGASTVDVYAVFN